MHIPSVSTEQLEILSFAQARELSGQNSNYDTNRWIYVPDFYTEYRYILGTRGKRSLICVGVNPSTAEPDNLDNTLKSVERIALNNGFDSFLMFNVYAQRATRPQDMESVRNEKLHRENMEAFRYALVAAGAEPTVWAAWGNIIEMRPYLKECVSDMLCIGTEYGARWVTAGKRSVKGHPHHPLYLKKDSPLDTFDAGKYCCDCL